MPTGVRRHWVDTLREQFGASVALCCDSVGLSRSAYYYRAKKSDDSAIESALLELVRRSPRWGFPKCVKRLRALGKRWNHKRIYRVYTGLKLNMRKRPKRRVPPRHPLPLRVPASMNVSWSLDFMSDVLEHGHRFRTFNVADDFNREVLGIDVNSGITSERVIQMLDRIAVWRGYPQRVRVDNGPEFQSITFADWAKENGVQIDFIEPGKPYQNAYIERLNRTYREDVLDLYSFANLDEVRQTTDDWIELYNCERPHDALNDMTPEQYRLTN